MPKIRVLIVDDHAVLRAGLRMLLEAQADMHVAGEAADAEEALRKARSTGPAVILLDLSMPGAVGTSLIERIAAECPRSSILVLTMHDDPAYAQTALAAGALGYIAKKAADTELLSAIRAVDRGRRFVDVSVVADLAPDLPARKPPGGPARAGATISPLSPREQEVLELLARGHTNREIAARVGIGVKTVETYRSRLGQKLGLRTRADLVSYALETGLLGRQDR